MADSDDESERRGSRDKFHRERSDFDVRRRPGDKREPFDDRSINFNSVYARNDNQFDENRFLNNERRRSPIAEPPAKRRKEYNDDYRNTTTKRKDIKSLSENDSIYRPPVMPFKRFLEPLDDLIGEDEACSKYKEYKISYQKKHVEEFFEAHKNEEWFRFRYHPDYMDTRKKLTADSVRYRLGVFMDLLNKGYFENQAVQMDNSESLIRIMDAVVIKLEGGTDEDLKILNETDHNRIMSDEEQSRSVKAFHSSSGHKSEGEAESDIDVDDSDKETNLKQYQNANQHFVNHGQSVRQHSLHSESSSSDDTGSESSSEENFGREKSKVFRSTSKNENDHQDHSTENCNSLKEVDEDDDVPTPTTAEAPERGCSDDGALPTSISSVLLNPTIQSTLDNVSIKQYKIGDHDQGLQKITCKSSKLLHKTASIFFRALPSTLKEAELREICASQPGFVRLALWDPVPERRFTRHAWATYEPNVNIKKVCWALNTSPLLRHSLNLLHGDLGATVNRDLAQRVRPLTSLTRHKPVMRRDLSLAAQLVSHFDWKYGLWVDGTDTDGNKSNDMELIDANGLTQTEQNALELALKSKNPLLKDLTDFLVDEGGSEEEALIGEATTTDNGDADGTLGRNNSISLESDSSLARVLDLLIIYLRVVHSLDYYAGAIYLLEDQMPHRCGIFHARGDRGLNSSTANGRISNLTFTQREVNEHLQNFTSKIRLLLDVSKDLTNEEMTKLGKRDLEKAVEDFVEANIQKRTGKKKPFKVVWVCPLSDKKFREPIFVRKHIFNKHMEKIEAAKKDNAIFFNNYLRDPKRPALPEAPYYMMNQYYPSSGNHGNNNHSMRGRGSGRGMNYRGGYRQNNNLFTSPRNSGNFQDYYDVSAQQQQHQAMAAVAAAAAAALYPSATAADIYALAAGSGHRTGNRRGRGSPQHQDYNSRSYGLTDSRRRRPMNYGGNRRIGHGPGDRSMISYNDLDNPVND